MRSLVPKKAGGRLRRKINNRRKTAAAVLAAVLALSAVHSSILPAFALEDIGGQTVTDTEINASETETQDPQQDPGTSDAEELDLEEQEDERPVYCGLEEHTHTDECYEKVLVCGFPEDEEEDKNVRVLITTEGTIEIPAGDTSDPADEQQGTEAGEPADTEPAETAGQDAADTETAPETVPGTETDGSGEVPAEPSQDFEAAPEGLEEIPEQDVPMANEVLGTQTYLACPLQVHVHDESCVDDFGNNLCGKADFVIHTHNESCYDAAGNLVCRLPEIKAHVHDDSCYEVRSVLICGQEESTGHTHTEECYAWNQELTCGQEESAGHTHTEACHHIETILTCGLEEGAGAHMHSESCYQTVEHLICQDTDPAHVHTSECYLQEQVLACGQEESAGHQHNDGCYTTTDQIICGLEETPGHMHSESCYTAVRGDLICGQEEREGHTHTDACWEEEKTLICGQEEVIPHTHTAECYTGLTEDYLEDGTVVPHVHTEACYNEAGWVVCGGLTCGMTEVLEHVHGPECFQTVETTPEAEEQTPQQDPAEDPEQSGEIVTDPDAEQPEGEPEVQNPDGEGQTDPAEDPGQTGETVTDPDAEQSEGEPDVQNPDGEGQTDPAEDPGQTDETGADPEEQDPEEETQDPEGHVHTDACYELQLICEKPEHTHTEECYVEPTDTMTMTAEGEGYSVTVTYGPEAEIPENAVLTTMEYEETDEEYAARKAELEESLGISADTETAAIANDVTSSDVAAEDAEPEPEKGLARMRLFDVSFMVDGEEIEPKAPVNVEFTFDDAEEMEASDIAHFAEEGTQVFEGDDLERNVTEDGKGTLGMSVDSFSPFATFQTMSAPLNTPYYTIYAINDFKTFSNGKGMTAIIHNVGGQYKTVGEVYAGGFTYWRAYRADYILPGHYQVTEINDKVGDKNSPDYDNKKDMELPTNGFILMVHDGYGEPINITVGKYINIGWDYSSIPKGSKEDGYGVINISDKIADKKPEKDNTEELTPIKGAETRDYIEVNLYDYGSNINEKYYADGEYKRYPGFQQQYGTLSINESEPLNSGSFNFGNNVMSDITAGKDGVTNEGGKINETQNHANEPISGALSNQLGDDGYPQLVEGSLSLKYLFDANGGYAEKQNKTSIDGLFLYDEETGEYSFNSRENFAQFNSENDTFTLYEQIFSPNFIMYPFGNFMPLNDIVHDSKHASEIDRTYLLQIAASAELKEQEGKSSTKGPNGNPGGEYGSLAGALRSLVKMMDKKYPAGWGAKDLVTEYFSKVGELPSPQEAIDKLLEIYSLDYDEPSNFYFGMEMKMNLMQPKGGMTGIHGDQRMVFDFSGDDDVWVYIDGRLFLDLSGIHRHVGGKIDFVDGTVTYYSLDPATGDTTKQLGDVKHFADLVADPSTLNENGTFKDYSQHTFNFYYMERGSGSSVCRMNFNFPLLKKDSISVTKKVDHTGEFVGNPDFRFRIMNEEGTELFIRPETPYDILDSAGNKIDSGTVGADGTFTLKANQTAVFSDIPENSGSYYVEELLDPNIKEQYGEVVVDGTVKVEGVEDGGFVGFRSPVKNINDGSITYFEFDNHINNEKYGSLSITKELVSTEADKQENKSFIFEVSLDGEPLPVGTPYIVKKGDGSSETRHVEEAGRIILMDGETVSIEKILAGSVYTVKEAGESSDGYTVSYQVNGEGSVNSLDGVNGVIIADGKANEVKVLCKNVKEPEPEAVSHRVIKKWIGESLDRLPVVLVAKVTINGEEQDVIDSLSYVFTGEPIDGNKNQTLPVEGAWEYTWEDLPRYYYDEKTGTYYEIAYTVSEQLTKEEKSQYDSKTVESTLDESGGTTTITTLTNKRREEWEIIKTGPDEETPVADAEFEMTLDSSAEVPEGITNPNIYYGKSDGKGVISWYSDKEHNVPVANTAIKAGTYTLKEVKAPDSYILSEETWKLVFETDGAVPSISKIKDDTEVPYEVEDKDGVKIYQFVFVNKKAEKWQIIKQDASDASKVVGAVFTMIPEGKESPSYVGTSGEDGIIQWKKCVEGTESDVEISPEEMEAGTYTLKETEAPDGYILTDMTWTVVIEKQGEKPTITYKDTDGSDEALPLKATESTDGGITTYTFTITNEKAVKWQIVKISSGSKDPLPGAEFKLEPKTGSSGTTYTGRSSSEEGNIGVIEWFAEGVEELDKPIPSTELEAGDYVLSETKSPAGYALSGVKWNVHIGKKGELPKITVQGTDPEKEISFVDDDKYGGICYVEFEDPVLYDLPSTGGEGIFRYLTSGMLLMMAAAWMIYKNRCREVLRS